MRRESESERRARVEEAIAAYRAARLLPGAPIAPAGIACQRAVPVADRNAEILYYYKRGLSQSAIAQRLAIGRATVRRVLGKANALVSGRSYAEAEGLRALALQATIDAAIEELVMADQADSR